MVLTSLQVAAWSRQGSEAVEQGSGAVGPPAAVAAAPVTQQRQLWLQAKGGKKAAALNPSSTQKTKGLEEEAAPLILVAMAKSPRGSSSWPMDTAPHRHLQVRDVKCGV